MLPIFCMLSCLPLVIHAWLSDFEKQLFVSRIYQSTLRGPRMPGSLEQVSFLDSVAASMNAIGASTSTLDYTMYRWDPRWWYISAELTNGSKIFIPTVGYYPYSGNTGVHGVTGPVWDAGVYLSGPDNVGANSSSLNFEGVPKGSIAFYLQGASSSDSDTSHHIETGRNISIDLIPEVGNLTNAHTTSKTLNFTDLSNRGVIAAIGAWTGVSDGEVALQWRPSSTQPAPPGTLNVPTLFVGESTGLMLHDLITSKQISNLTVMLDAPSFNASTYTLLATLPGTAKRTNETLLLYSHSDGPSCVEENGGFAILTMLEYFAHNPLSLDIQVVIETGHMSYGLLNETAWMGQQPQILQNAKAALMIEHLGAKQYKDVLVDGTPTYKYTGKTEAIFSYANASSRSDFIRRAYLEAYEDTPDYMRMPLMTPDVAGGKVTGNWPGLGGASQIGLSGIPTIGLEVQPDYLWAFMIDGGWDRFHSEQATIQVETLIKTAWAVDQAWQNGTLYG